MFKKKYTYLVIAVAAIALVFISTVFANPPSPGAEQDPLVSKSYVDNLVADAIKIASGTNATGGSSIDMDRIISEVKSELSKTSVEAYVPVNATKGQTIIGHEGTEIILRSGKATALCPESNGVVNVSSGSDLLNGAEVKANNLLIVPRYDGRGVYVTSNDAWFLIKGGYDKTN